MDEEKMEQPLDEAREVYTPRPWWQIALAWVLLILVIIGVGFYYYWIVYRY